MLSVHRSCLVGLVLTSAAICGCRHHLPMALEGTGGALDLSSSSVVLLSLRVENEYRPRFKPRAEVVVVEPIGETSAGVDVAKEHASDMGSFQLRSQVGGGKGWQTFKVGKPDAGASSGPRDYLLSMALAPGKYRLRYIVATATVVPYHPTGKAWSLVPIYADFGIEPGKVQYAGSIEAINQKRTEGAQLRAGPIFRMFEQSMAGFSDGTYSVTITDRYDEDVPAFRHAYPALETCEITRTILRPIGPRLEATRQADSR
jgi:hypothetical protein